MVEPLERPLSSYIHTQFVTADENTSVAEAVKILQPKHVEIVLVTSSTSKGKYVGIVTDSDILEKVVMKGEVPNSVFLKSIMSAPIRTLPSSATVKQAIQLMRIHKIKHLPVTDITNKEQIIGTVTQEYLAEAIRIAVIEKTFRSYRKVIRERYKPILANVSIILQFSGLLMVIPALLGTFLGEWKSSIGINMAFVGMFLTGYVMNILGEKSPLNLKQSSIVVVLSFVLLSLFGSLPYMYVNPFNEGIDLFSLFASSFLESSSGFTTTGISTIIYPENLPESFSFYRSYTELVGGLSFVYLIMALYYPETKLAGMKHLWGGILRFKQLLSTICIIFTVYTAIVALLLYFFGNVNILDSISLGFATLASGGFVPASTILNVENTVPLVIISVGMIVAALPFAFHFGVFSKNVEATRELKEIIIYIILIGISVFLFIIIESSFLEEKEWLSSAFHVISASTTTGFQFADLSQISLYGKILLIVVMLVGGTAFSTAGGIKIARLLLIFQKLLNNKKSTRTFNDKKSFSRPSLISATAIQFRKRIPQPFKSYNHKNKEEAKNNKQITCAVPLDKYKFNILSDKAFREALFVVFLFIFFTFITALFIYYLNIKNTSFIDALFETASTVSNNGLTIGLTTMDLDSISKLILSFNMIMGRFEIIAILYIFVSRLRR
jgi:trk system potassium uptake protein